MEIRLPNTVKKAIDLLGAAGFEAYCVGGALRDFFFIRNQKILILRLTQLLNKWKRSFLISTVSVPEFAMIR